MIIDPYTWHRFAIGIITSVSVDTVAVRLPRPATYSFRAGQYAVVRITKSDGKQFIRQYSFSSAPDDAQLELLVQKEPGGDVSGWFHDEAKKGDVIELSQPLGSFTIEKTNTRSILCIAGRIGIAPFISMLRDKKTRKIKVLYSVRSQDQVIFEELQLTHNTAIVDTSRSPRLGQDSLLPLLTNQPLVYICGSKQFVDTLSTALIELGVTAADIKRELFTLQ